MSNEDIRDAIHAFESDDDDDDEFIRKLKQDLPSDMVADDGDDDYDDDDDEEEEDEDYAALAPADDPVRMYLKEIGQVLLLDTNREMWLSTQIAAERLLQSLQDELASLDRVGDEEVKVANSADVVRHALVASGLSAHQISYLEAHGTGTALGDPIELAGLQQVFGQEPERGAYCAIGSVKSNIGHCEAAAGIAGLTKVLLQMRHRTLVKSLHSERLNPKLDFSRGPFAVQTVSAAWDVSSGVRAAGRFAPRRRSAH